MSKIFTRPNRPLDWAATPHDFSGDNALGYYTAEAVQRYVYGTRWTTWDGRVYKYYNAVSACYSYHGAGAAEPACLGYTAAPVAHAAGTRAITATLASRSEDDLAGTAMIIYDASGTDANFNAFIVGNDATSGSTTTCYLEFPLPVAITTSDAYEIFENPYRELQEATNSYLFWHGVPMKNLTAAQKGWIQTWGPSIVSSGESVGSPGADTRLLRWGSNASIFTESSKANAQIAGALLTGSSTAYGPLIMLQCST